MIAISILADCDKTLWLFQFQF